MYRIRKVRVRPGRAPDNLLLTCLLLPRGHFRLLSNSNYNITFRIILGKRKINFYFGLFWLRFESAECNMFLTKGGNMFITKDTQEAENKRFAARDISR